MQRVDIIRSNLLKYGSVVESNVEKKNKIKEKYREIKQSGVGIFRKEKRRGDKRREKKRKKCHVYT